MSAPRPQNYERAEDQTDASDKSPVSKLAKIRSSQGPLNQYHVYSVWQLARLSLCSVLLPRRRGPRLCVLCALAGISLLWLMLVIRNQDSTRWGGTLAEDPTAIKCVSWRSTDWCHPNGKHLPDRDVPCHAQVPDSAGYCECSGGLTIAHVACGPHRFTCADKCSELSVSQDRSLGKPLPTLMQCGRHSSSSSSYGTIQSPHKFPPQSTHLTITAAQLQDAGAALAKRASAWQDALEQQRKGEQQAKAAGSDASRTSSTFSQLNSATASSILAAAASAGQLHSEASAAAHTTSSVSATAASAHAHGVGGAASAAAGGVGGTSAAAAAGVTHSAGAGAAGAAMATATTVSHVLQVARGEHGGGGVLIRGGSDTGQAQGRAQQQQQQQQQRWSSRSLQQAVDVEGADDEELDAHLSLSSESDSESDSPASGADSRSLVEVEGGGSRKGGGTQLGGHKAGWASAGMSIPAPPPTATQYSTQDSAAQGPPAPPQLPKPSAATASWSSHSYQNQKPASSSKKASSSITQDAKDKLQRLKEKLLDSDMAVHARVQRLKRSRASLSAPGSPRAYTGFDMAAWAEAVAVFEKQARKLWDDVGGLVRRHSHREDVARLPSERTQRRDWVADGVRLAAESVGELRADVRRFKESLPAYPSQLFSGRGVVMISGGLKYMVSAWISLNMLRRSGCTLPVEMWFPIAELPTPELEEELVAQGVIVRTFDQRDLDQSGFTLKVTALLLSSFQEVLFIDADNFAVRDPTALFHSREFNVTGALLWQDFWAASTAPEIYDILEIPPDLRPTWSHESGQIVVDKSRHWHGLLLCIYLNYYHELYYELLTNFMGKGDKETFAYAMLSVGEPVHTVSRPTDALGIKRSSCELLRDGHLVCTPLFACNTMVQRDPGGGVLFLHSNLNKWTLDLPDSFADYSRRWQLLAAHGGQEPQDFPAWVKQQLGFDVEETVYNLVRSFRCAPWFDEYYRMRLRRGDAAMSQFRGMHELVEGMDLLDWYRHGLPGPYAGMLSWRGAHDELLHAWNGRVKPLWRAVRQWVRRWWSGEGPYFRPAPGAKTSAGSNKEARLTAIRRRRRVIN